MPTFPAQSPATSGLPDGGLSAATSGLLEATSGPPVGVSIVPIDPLAGAVEVTRAPVFRFKLVADFPGLFILPVPWLNVRYKQDPTPDGTTGWVDVIVAGVFQPVFQGSSSKTYSFLRADGFWEQYVDISVQFGLLPGSVGSLEVTYDVDQLTWTFDVTDQAVATTSLAIGKGVESSRCAVGSPHRIAFTLPPGSSETVEAKIRIAGDANWTDLTLAEVTVPAGHQRIFEADFVPLIKGWHCVSFSTSVDGGDSTQTFFAYGVEGAIRTQHTSKSLGA